MGINWLTSKAHEKIRKSILSCITVDHMHSCKDWLERIDMPNLHRAIYLDKLHYKLKEIDDGES